MNVFVEIFPVKFCTNCYNFFQYELHVQPIVTPKKAKWGREKVEDKWKKAKGEEEAEKNKGSKE